MNKHFSFALWFLAIGFFCFSSCGIEAAERPIAIKAAQYNANIEFLCPGGGVWDMGGKTGGIQGPDRCLLTGVLEKKAVKRYHVMVASVRLSDKERIDRTVSEWETQGWKVNTIILGLQFLGMDGKTVIFDNRISNVEVGVFPDQQSAQALVDKLAAQGKSAWIFVEVVSMSRGRLTFSINGTVVAEGVDLMIVPNQMTLLKKVEYAVGYPWHGFADRNYRGSMNCRWGAQDAVDCVLTTPLETVLAGVVPSEISSKAEIGALQAQAVAARGEILAKIGIRHSGEGFDICSEQHCQVFAGETPAAVEIASKIAPTRGLVLADSSGGLVDAVYAANCGGHGEASHLVWSTPPNPILAGVWDSRNPPNLDLSEEKQVGAFISTPPDCFCKDPTVEGGANFRWKKTLSPADWKGVENTVGIGRIKNITDIARGFSGRIYRLTFVGENGSKTVMKELYIRKLFGGLKSSCFISAWTRGPEGFFTGAELSGAGFGHGVGMCQTGAQSRAKHGMSFDRILIHYFPGSSLKKWY